MEGAIIGQIQADPCLTPEQRGRLSRQIEERIERGEFGGDDDRLASLVRKAPSTRPSRTGGRGGEAG